MQIDRIWLCYETGDKIILDKESQLERFDLSKVSAIEARIVGLSREEFDRLRAFNQITLPGTSENIALVPDSGAEGNHAEK